MKFTSCRTLHMPSGSRPPMESEILSPEETAELLPRYPGFGIIAE